MHAALPTALLCAASMFAAAAQAAGPVPASLQACAKLRADIERLACYDALAHRERQAPPRVPADVARVHEVDPALAANDLFPLEALAQPGFVSLLNARWELEPDSKLGIFNLRAHKPVLLLPVYWNDDPNQRPTSPNPANQVQDGLGLQSIENKFQLSFKTKVLQDVFGGYGGDLWFGYTQSSRWQLYNEAQSRPFRETNYEPEIQLVFGTEATLFGWDAHLLGLGYVHQSNGRSLPLSRSWDRLTATFGFEREHWVVVARPWLRFEERDAKDDNPDIENYLGRADVTIVHQRGEHELALLLRHSLRSGENSRGGAQFDWSFPLWGTNLRGHLQLFDGYGESLIDYNHRATYIGVGLSLLPWY